MTVALPRHHGERRRHGDRRRPVVVARARWSPPGEPSATSTVLTTIVAVLVLFGLVMVLSSSSLVALTETRSTWSYAVRQALWAAIGTVGLLAALWSDRRMWRRACRIALVGVVLLLAAVLVAGTTVNGATRWLVLGPIQVQPSELAKPALILFVADLLARRSRDVDDPRRTLWPAVGVTAVVSVLVLLQPNLGTTLVIVALVGTILLAAGVSLRPLAGLGAVVGVGAALLVWFEPYRRRRLLAMFDPWANEKGSGYQAIQAHVGLADGGLTGLGLGQSRAKWGYLPFAHTDFVFAIIGEELGLIGALLTLSLFVGLAFVGVRAAMAAADRFSTLVAAGITAWFVSQAFLNVGVVVGLLPNTGVPLPFVSYGGTSLLVTMVGAGMLINIARHPRASAAGS